MSTLSKAILYVHGKNGRPNEANHYKQLFPESSLYGLDYKGNTPWDTKKEFQEAYDKLSARYDAVMIIASSIGAYFVMHALHDRKIEKAFFISPVVHMEKLICDMMRWAGISEEELLEKGEILTGEHWFHTKEQMEYLDQWIKLVKCPKG